MRRASLLATTFLALLILAILYLALLTSCAPTTWLKQRSDCGLRCPHNSSCSKVVSGVFAASFSCLCDYGYTAKGERFPSEGDPCPGPATYSLCDGARLSFVVCRAASQEVRDVPKPQCPWPHGDHCDCYVGRGVQDSQDLYSFQACLTRLPANQLEVR